VIKSLKFSTLCTSGKKCQHYEQVLQRLQVRYFIQMVKRLKKST